MDQTQEQQMRSEFAEYMDSDGLLTPTLHPTVNSTGNGILYTAYMYMTYCQWGVLNAQDQANFVATLQKCRVTGPSGPINGLYNRSPEAINNQEGPDDYYGLSSGAGSAYANVQLARDILSYGESTSFLGFIHYIYNNITPGKFSFSAWMGRQFLFPAHLYFCNGQTPALWRRIWWALSMLVSATANPGDNQDIVLTWCVAAAMTGDSGLCNWAKKNWYDRLNRDWTGGMGQVFSVYFNNPQHPLARWFQTTMPGQSAAAQPRVLP